MKKDKHAKKYHDDYMARMEGKTAGGPRDQPMGSKSKKSEPESNQPKITYVGCYGSENNLPKAKEYVGGGTGAGLAMAAGFAQENGKTYFAVARVGNDGHSFYFDEAPSGNKMDDEGCRRECTDSPNPCGCADGGCGELAAVVGEEHKRRWVVYKVEAAKKKKKKSSKKKKKAKKGKEEL